MRSAARAIGSLGCAIACAIVPSGCTDYSTETAVYAVARDDSTLADCRQNARSVLAATGYGNVNDASNAANGTGMVFGTKDQIIATVVCNPSARSTTVVFDGAAGAEMNAALQLFGGAYTAASRGEVAVPPTPAATGHKRTRGTP